MSAASSEESGVEVVSSGRKVEYSVAAESVVESAGEYSCHCLVVVVKSVIDVDH